MPARALLIEIRFVEGRYHGNDDWPPSPFRLYQALVAGAYGGRWVREDAAEKDEAFHWLERLDPPQIAAPPMRAGDRVALFVPNNDLDACGGDPLRTGNIRVMKRVAPRFFDCGSPILYAWPFDGGDKHAATMASMAERLHTLGLGLDSAYARSEAISWDEAEARLAAQGWQIVRPGGASPQGLTCPVAGSLESLKRRYGESSRRFSSQGRAIRFANASKPRFRLVAYGSLKRRLLFDLIGSDGDRRAWRLDRIVRLTELLRGAVAEKLKKALPAQASTIDNVIIGCRDSNEADKAARLRITPLPSIGARHADHAIRRVLIEIPPNCPLRARDVEWAFSGLPWLVSENGEILSELVPAAESGMLAHYGLDEGVARLWRTVTPAALPESAARRRTDPARIRERGEQKGGKERAREEARAAGSVVQALRHAGVRAKAEALRVQREPFEAKSGGVEDFAPETRFAKERLWHVEVEFSQPVPGPLIIGDGRYLGLGLMAPVRGAWRDALVFSLSLETLPAVADRLGLLTAVRRALMARARKSDGSVPTLFSGHEPGGARAHSGRHRHIFLAAADLDGDGRLDQLIVAAPWACDRSAAPELAERAEFDQVASSLKTVRAGPLGVVALGPPSSPNKAEALFTTSHEWQSCTPYRPTRHARRSNQPAEAVGLDLIAECLRRGLPRPEVEIQEISTGPNGGNLNVRARLVFSVAVDGPLLLGRDSHAGGGLFEGMRIELSGGQQTSNSVGLVISKSSSAAASDGSRF